MNHHLLEGCQKKTTTLHRFERDNKFASPQQELTRVPQTYEEAKTFLTTFPKDKLPGIQVLSGVSQSNNFAVSTPEEILHLNTRGYRRHIVSMNHADGHAKKDHTVETLWKENTLLASCYQGKIDETETQKHAARNLVIASLPLFVTTHHPKLQAVGYWLNPDIEDLTYPKAIKTWEVARIGGKTYFLYPERGVAPLGCCRAISLRTLTIQFQRFPGFKEVLSQKEALWEGITQGLQEEKIPCP